MPASFRDRPKPDPNYVNHGVRSKLPAVDFRSNLSCAFFNFRGILTLPHFLVRLSQRGQRSDQIKMRRSQMLFTYAERSLKKSFGVSILALPQVQGSQINKRFGDIGMLGPQDFSLISRDRFRRVRRQASVTPGLATFETKLFNDCQMRTTRPQLLLPYPQDRLYRASASAFFPCTLQTSARLFSDKATSR